MITEVKFPKDVREEYYSREMRRLWKEGYTDLKVREMFAESWVEGAEEGLRDRFRTIYKHAGGRISVEKMYELMVESSAYHWITRELFESWCKSEEVYRMLYSKGKQWAEKEGVNKRLEESWVENFVLGYEKCVVESVWEGDYSIKRGAEKLGCTMEDLQIRMWEEYEGSEEDEEDESVIIDSGIPYLKIVKAEYLGAFKLFLEFSDGAEKVYDGKELLHGPAFEPLQDEEVFKNFKLVRGAVTWLDETVDCSQYHMYDYGTDVEKNIWNGEENAVFEGKEKSYSEKETNG